jgi:hypothetical protein
MADYSGTNYNKIYVAEPKELGDAGTQDVKPRFLYDEAPGALLAADRVAIGILPENARIIRFSELSGDASTLEQADTTALAIGEKVTEPTVVYAVAAAGVAAGQFLLEYLQA